MHFCSQIMPRLSAVLSIPADASFPRVPLSIHKQLFGEGTQKDAAQRNTFGRRVIHNLRNPALLKCQSESHVCFPGRLTLGHIPLDLQIDTPFRISHTTAPAAPGDWRQATARFCGGAPLLQSVKFRFPGRVPPGRVPKTTARL